MITVVERSAGGLPRGWRVRPGVRLGPHRGKIPATSLLSERTGGVSRVPQVTVSRAGLPVAGILGVPVAGPGRGFGWGSLS